MERGHEAGAAGQRAGAALLRAQHGHQVLSSTQSLANSEIKASHCSFTEHGLQFNVSVGDLQQRIDQVQCTE